ncbi:hypothetical protein SISNIDRAFT_418863 [Sistotremastrum niveocremeum HHB9708]|uniref:3'-5' exonuclease domain-containing protein n=2 Tax=Sistotremastraceae TaxID=3402574 RepID=A0A164NRD8_9AGAM|nr:hypothetical protein SISNIDRAFT_418863 [Sistotremastrum niveocremeum HHB9708]KZT38430.1 hypothetical protein SISSUDRAFT_1061980 [Sistotremastrum suecicum HHB10207 ss-3]
MSSDHDTYLLCDTTKKLKRVVKALNRAAAIILDCEAHNIGYVGGQLSIISLGIADSLPSSDPRLHPYQPVFIVDVLAFSKAQLRPFYDILEDGSIVKVVFGGRHDFSELYHGQGVDLRGVVDLQIADVVSREVRGEGFEEQMRRLGQYGDDRAIWDSTLQARYVGVHRLCGLVACVEEHDIDTSCIPHKLKPHHSTKWLKRPLSVDQLIYAAGDILLIDLLYDHFTIEGYIGSELEEQSEDYISLHLAERVPKNDPYWSHALLPLEIINQADGVPMTCQGCQRVMPSGCFALVKKSRKRRVREDKCFVCSTIDAACPPSNSSSQSHGLRVVHQPAPDIWRQFEFDLRRELERMLISRSYPYQYYH